MLETSTNGAGAAPEAAAAGREDQLGVAEPGFGAGGRAAPAGVPDPELVEQAQRRPFTAKYKAGILAKADACTKPGEVGELRRDEEIAQLQRKLERSEAELAKMKRVVEIQGNVSLRREAPCGRR